MAPGGDVVNAPGAGSPIAVMRMVSATSTETRVHVFAIDGHGRMQEALEGNRGVVVGWDPWAPLSALPGGERLDQASRLAATQSGGLSLWLFGRSDAGNAMTIEFAPGRGWGGWLDLGGNVLGDLACGRLDDGRLEVFGRRTGNSRLMARRMVGPDRWM